MEPWWSRGAGRGKRHRGGKETSEVRGAIVTWISRRLRPMEATGWFGETPGGPWEAGQGTAWEHRIRAGLRS